MEEGKEAVVSVHKCYDMYKDQHMARVDVFIPQDKKTYHLAFNNTTTSAEAIVRGLQRLIEEIENSEPSGN